MLDTVNTVKTDTHYWSGHIYYTYTMCMWTRGVVMIITLRARRPSYRGSSRLRSVKTHQFKVNMQLMCFD